ncbi:uncharacterized protein LOC127278874 [Leptopilina boulardi]|uniref:uncharacterized protein LOC127278874 n=1 Tax=Leptopilina boulardi TaxID=63433 RepID=UPI0021F625D5|nr:uncharacterized protein LOC127278874 [Leptopilina boulardi]
MNIRNKVIAAYLLRRRHLMRNRKSVKRAHWVHPINQLRESEKQFNKLFLRLREDENKFFNFFRMSKSSFDELHDGLKDVIKSEETTFRNSIPTVEMLGITLRYLASGYTFLDLHYNFKIGASTARKIVKKVCSAIWLIMKDECIPEVTKERWGKISDDFEKDANFPYCLGAVDGKHIRLQGNLWKAIESNLIELTEDKCLPGTSDQKIPHFLVGDEAFGLHKHLMRPYGGSHLTRMKIIFNYRLCRARRFVECAFGILTNKWRIFHRPLNVHPNFANILIKACVVLHNFIRDKGGFVPEHTTTLIGLEDLQPDQSVQAGISANSVRDVLGNYFLTDVGSVPWQMSKIYFEIPTLREMVG